MFGPLTVSRKKLQRDGVALKLKLGCKCPIQCSYTLKIAMQTAERIARPKPLQPRLHVGERNVVEVNRMGIHSYMPFSYSVYSRMRGDCHF